VAEVFDFQRPLQRRLSSVAFLLCKTSLLKNFENNVCQGEKLYNKVLRCITIYILGKLQKLRTHHFLVLTQENRCKRNSRLFNAA